MKNRIAILLAISLTFGNFGCAAMKRHPVVTGAVIGLAAGVTVAIVTHHSCPKMINGYPYDGTPVNGHCPDPATYDPGARRSK